MTEQSNSSPRERWTFGRFERALRGMELKLQPLEGEDGKVVGYAVGSDDWLAFFLGGEGNNIDSVWLQAKISDAANLEAVERCNREIRFIRVVQLAKSAEAWMDIWLVGLTEESLVPNIQFWQHHLKQARAFFSD